MTLTPQNLLPVSRRDQFYALMWALAFCASAMFCAWKIVYQKPFHSNLLELLPHDERNPALHDLSVLMASRFENKLLVLVSNGGAEQTLPIAKDLKTRLESSTHVNVNNAPQAIQQELTKLYRPFSQQLLTPERREWLVANTPADLAEQTYRELFSPVALPRPYSFIEDPFNLGGHWLTGLIPRAKIQDYQGFPMVLEEREGTTQAWVLVTATLSGSAFDVAVQNDVSRTVEGFRQAWPAAKVLTSGMIFHATAGTRQATREMNTVGLGSTICIVILVLLVFRRITPLVAVLISMTSAYVLALATSLLVFGSIHIITLAFGSTLLGVAGDYAIHFLVGSHAQGGGLAARHHLRYAMAIGAITGMGAYLLQFTTPFPGLQQMAIFCAAGIFGAWMTVLALAPFYRVTPLSGNAIVPSNTPIVAARSFYAVAEWLYPGLWRNPRRIGAFLTILTIAGLLTIARGGTNDSVINLNTSPLALLNSEQRVQEILQQPSVSRFFYIEAESSEQLLMRTQALNEKLSGLNDPDLRWQSLQQYSPSHTQQQADRQLIKDKLYGEQGSLAILCQKLGAPCTSPAPNEKSLLPDVVSATALGELLPPLMRDGQHWRTLVTLSGNGQNAGLTTLADGLEGVKLVNQTEDLSALLGRYRTSVSEVLLVTLILLAVGLTWRYGHHGWRMLVPLMISMTLALAVAAVGGITLFHIMALLLIIGIGLDTAVFYTEGGFNAESWLASSLSCGTSIIAFGLLSLSAVPVLHQFGLIILVGMFSCWLLTPLFFKASSDSQNSYNNK